MSKLSPVAPEELFDADVVTQLGYELDQFGLRNERNRVIIVGGAAMAAMGLKPLEDTDIDVVATKRLMKRIQKAGDLLRLAGPVDTSEDSGISFERPVYTVDSTTGYRSIRTNERALTIMTVPLDGLYLASYAELSLSSVVPKSATGGYWYLSPEKIVEWKTALVTHPEYQGDKGKHIEDINKLLGHVASFHSSRDERVSTR